jgi:transposase
MIEKDTLTDYEQLRKAAITYRETHTLLETALVFSKTPKTIVSWCKKYKATGLLTKAAQGGKRHCIVDKEGEDFILKTVEEENDLTLKKVSQRYLERFGIVIGQSTVDYHLRKHGITLKKKVFTTPNKKKPPI